MTYKSAKGLKGMIMGCTAEGLAIFRIKADNKDGFEDIYINHYDMDVEIIDDDAYIRKHKDNNTDDQRYIDYSNATLGRKDEK